MGICASRKGDVKEPETNTREPDQPNAQNETNPDTQQVNNKDVTQTEQDDPKKGRSSKQPPRIKTAHVDQNEEKSDEQYEYEEDEEADKQQEAEKQLALKIVSNAVDQKIESSDSLDAANDTFQLSESKKSSEPSLLTLPQVVQPVQPLQTEPIKQPEPEQIAPVHPQPEQPEQPVTQIQPEPQLSEQIQPEKIQPIEKEIEKEPEQKPKEIRNISDLQPEPSQIVRRRPALKPIVQKTDYSQTVFSKQQLIKNEVKNEEEEPEVIDTTLTKNEGHLKIINEVEGETIGQLTNDPIEDKQKKIIKKRKVKLAESQNAQQIDLLEELEDKDKPTEDKRKRKTRNHLKSLEDKNDTEHEKEPEAETENEEKEKEKDKKEEPKQKDKIDDLLAGLVGEDNFGL
ncbi:Hypothetical_protein [Hexamita inflata]|uniref:Hypothetical_protein n=1 Tax=Hexamita inflata TaxID=28002 RepID=A0AA86P540_9EUKA|nr:Hypothetical protein HINF_LOCUS20052 [Hexamita inflata]